MKTFYIIITAFAITISGIAINSSYVRHFTEEARAELSEIEYDSADAVQRLEAFIKNSESHLNKIEFSIPRGKSDLVTDHLSAMETQLKNQNRPDFEQSRALLDNLLKEIGRLEEISLRNLF